MKPEEYLSGLASTLNLTETEQEQISQKHLSLRESLRDKLPVEDDFLTGSYPRNTMIRPKGDEKFDVDFFLAFSNSEFGEYELPKLLETVKVALEEIKDNDQDIVKIIVQNRSIGVEYDDNFQIDVVPAIEIEKDELYKIFDKKSRQPVKSNPKLHGSILSEANEDTENNSIRRLVPIIKLLKSWKRDKCDYVKSFHLELLAVEILKNEQIESYSYGLVKFFTSAYEKLQEACLTDPANEENIVDAYLDEEGTRDELLELVGKEEIIAAQAWQSENDGEYDMAVKGWKRIFENNNEEINSNNPKLKSPVVIGSSPAKPWCNE